MSAPLKVAILVGSVRGGAFAPKVASVFAKSLAPRATVTLVDPAEARYSWLATLEKPYHHRVADKSVTPEETAVHTMLKEQDALVVVSGTCVVG